MQPFVGDGLASPFTLIRWPAPDSCIMAGAPCVFMAAWYVLVSVASSTNDAPNADV